MSTTITTTKIGAGGFVVGIDIAPDGTKVVRCDSYGAYWYNPATINSGNANRTGAWQQIINQSSMPSSAQTLNYAAFRGCTELRLCPSNPSHFYMLYAADGQNTDLYTSTNSGATWTKLNNFTSFFMSNGPNDTYRLSGPFLAVDPANENTLFVGSPSSGVQRSLDGGSTWNTVPTVGNSNGQWSIPVFDPTTTSGGNTPGVYIFTNGTGLYHSTNTGGASSLISSSPTACLHMIVDQAGAVWLTAGTSEGGGTLNRYNGSWTAFSSQSAGSNQSMAVSPGNANVIYLMTAGGAMWVTLDGGTNWIQLATVTRVATDIPWLQNTNETFMSAADIRFDPTHTQWTTSTTSNTIGTSGSKTFTTVSSMGLPNGTIVTVYETSAPANVMQGTVTSNVGTSLSLTITAGSGSGTFTDWTIGTTKLYFSEGIGVWFSTPPVLGSQTLTWTSESSAIEQLVPRWIISPWGGSSFPILTSEDRPIFLLNAPTVYPTNHGLDYRAAICHGWCADWAGQVPTTIAALVGASGFPGISTNGGATWSVFGNSGATTVPLGFAGLGGGSIAIAATTTSHIIILQSSTFGGYQTTDGGVTWNVMTYPNSIPSAGALVTSASGISPLTFSSVPSWLSSGVAGGSSYTFFTNSNAAGTVTGTTGTTVTTTGTSGSVGSGDTVFFRVNSGFGFSSFVNRQGLASDRVTDDVFYAYNEGIGGTTQGFYKSTNAGTTWVQQSSSVTSPTTCPANAEGVEQLRSVPGHAGHLWFTAGAHFSSTGHPNATPFWRSIDGGATWSKPNASVQEVWAFGFGKADPSGSGYPAIYMFGWVTSIDATYAGIYCSTDEAATWTRLSPSGITGQFPNGSLDSVITVEGDANIYGTFYIGFGGSGWATGSLDSGSVTPALGFSVITDSGQRRTRMIGY